MRYIHCMMLILISSALFAQEKGEPVLPIEEEHRRLTNAIETKNWQQGEDAAIRILKQLEKDPELLKRYENIHADVRYHYGLCLLNLGKLKEASEQFNRTIKLDENFLDAYVGLALVFDKENNSPQTKKQIERAVSKGYPVREIQKISELRKYLLESLQFFIRLIELEQEFTVKAEQEEDPFGCPLRRRIVGRGPIAETKEPVSVKEQSFILKVFKDLLQQLKNAIVGGLDPTKEFDEAEKHYNDNIDRMSGKLKEEMETLWAEAKRKHKEAIERIKKEKILGELSDSLAELTKAYKERNPTKGEKAYKRMEKQFEMAAEFKSDFDFQDEVRKIKEKAEFFHERLLVVKEFIQKILPNIRFCCVIEKPDAKPLVVLEVPSPDGGTIQEHLQEGSGVPGFGDEVMKVLIVGRYNPWLEELTLIYKNVPLKLTLRGKTEKSSLSPTEEEKETVR